MSQRLWASHTISLPSVLVLGEGNDSYSSEIGRMHRRTCRFRIGATDNISSLELPRNIEGPLQSIGGGHLQTQEGPLQTRILDLLFNIVVEGRDRVGLLLDAIDYCSRGLEDNATHTSFPGSLEECRRKAGHGCQQEYCRDIFKCCREALRIRKV